MSNQYRQLRSGSAYSTFTISAFLRAGTPLRINKVNPNSLAAPYYASKYSKLYHGDIRRNQSIHKQINQDLWSMFIISSHDCRQETGSRHQSSWSSGKAEVALVWHWAGGTESSWPGWAIRTPGRLLCAQFFVPLGSH